MNIKLRWIDLMTGLEVGSFIEITIQRDLKEEKKIWES